MTEGELISGLLDSAAEDGVSYEQRKSQVAAEASAAIDWSAAPTGGSMTLSSSGSGSGGGGGSVAMFPRGDRRGDILYHPSSTAGFDHGHVAVFDRPAYITEAPGDDEKSRTIWRQAPRPAPRGTTYYKVGANAERRDEAAYRAYHKYRDKEYQSRFFDNKDDGDGKLNCSELVWKSFKYLFPENLRIDLDSNGGMGVYPKDIRDSSYLEHYKTV